VTKESRMDEKEIKKVVRKKYANIAKTNSSCCAPVRSCFKNMDIAKKISKNIGYGDKELESVPDGANLGLGCGNPVALASIKEGETVLDLGSGAGFDCFLAANRVGIKGKVIGVDMTSEMIEKARENARKGKYNNVEFRFGEIEHLPVDDNDVDVVISNCVINLSPNKKSVFQEVFRVLKPGGRLFVSDIVLLKELPGSIKNSIAAYTGCISGAMMKDEYIKIVKESGFHDVHIIDETIFSIDCVAHDPTTNVAISKSGISVENLKDVENSVVSIKVEAWK